MVEFLFCFFFVLESTIPMTLDMPSRPSRYWILLLFVFVDLLIVSRAALSDHFRVNRLDTSFLTLTVLWSCIYQLKYISIRVQCAQYVVSWTWELRTFSFPHNVFIFKAHFLNDVNRGVSQTNGSVNLMRTIKNLFENKELAIASRMVLIAGLLNWLDIEFISAFIHLVGVTFSVFALWHNNIEE